MDNRINVVWICHFSDSKIRDNIRFDRFYFKKVLKPNYHFSDFAVWVSNALVEFEKFEDVKLTVIFPHAGVKCGIQKMTIDNIDYYCFRSQDDNIISYISNKIKNKFSKYKRNRSIIEKIIKSVKPDIVHLIGAENPYYSYSLLDIPKEIPTIVSLQTLLSEPEFLDNFPMTREEWEYRSDIERKVLKETTFIGSNSIKYRNSIRERINPNASFLSIKLALGPKIDITPVNKEFDFVYFAIDISKAVDYAIEAFALVVNKHPEVTLNVSGYYSDNYKKTLDSRLSELGIEKNVYFTGHLETHEDVIEQIKKARFALLPLKIDLISGTIREAMACGLPVVTTITPSTPKLNDKRDCVLLSEKGDYIGMADNMIKLIENKEFANLIRENAIKTITERYSNESFMDGWRKAYHEILYNNK